MEEFKDGGGVDPTLLKNHNISPRHKSSLRATSKTRELITRWKCTFLDIYRNHVYIFDGFNIIFHISYFNIITFGPYL